MELSIVAGCFNEESNVRELYKRLSDTLAAAGIKNYEILLADNASTDRTVDILRDIARYDKRLKVLVSTRNFGHIRSAYNAFLLAKGDAVILMASDLQDPPEMISDMIGWWRQGKKIVLAQKTESEESPLFFLVRKLYYSIIDRISEANLTKNVTGYGLYDREVVESIRLVNDPYPYMRGLICEFGYEQKLIPFRQPNRKAGISKNNFYVLWDFAMLGITYHSKVPLRISTLIGFIVGSLSLLMGFFYLLYKFFYWDSFQLGFAPIVIGMFFLGGVQMIFLGIIGEYVGAILTKSLGRPPAIIREYINFD